MIHLNLDEQLFNETKEINEKDINNIVTIALEDESIADKEIFLSISCADKPEIRTLNKKYRNVDKVTDVLSFPIFTKEELVTTKFSQIELGDIIICLDVVKDQSIEYNTGYKRELLYMITHGVCHLLRI